MKLSTLAIAGLLTLGSAGTALADTYVENSTIYRRTNGYGRVDFQGNSNTNGVRRYTSGSFEFEAKERDGRRTDRIEFEGDYAFDRGRERYTDRSSYVGYEQGSYVEHETTNVSRAGY